MRAPNIVELFSAQSQNLDGSTDPCTTTNTAGGVVPPTATQAQCALTGLSAAQYGNVAGNPANQYNGLLGGNPNLTPEVADSYTAGVVVTPTFLRGFQATVDYFNIKLRNQIGVLGADNILNQCLTTGAAAYCSLINRGASGRLDRPDGFIVDTNLNAGKLSTKGIDVTVAYTREIGRFGTLGLSVVGTYLDSLTTETPGSDPYNCKGYFGNVCGTPNPEWRHKARGTFTLPQGPSASLAWRYFSGVDNEQVSGDNALPGGAGTRPGNARIDSQSYFDLTFTYPVADKFTFQVGANNILDREPPLNGLGLAVFGNGNTFPQVYDGLGRYIFAGVTLDL